jgi:endonuclease/exonuclease/phosphatase family metal-dependent hydrolase
MKYLRLLGLHCMAMAAVLCSCDPLVTQFEPVEDAVMYHAERERPAAAVDALTVMTWNIRFAAGRNMPWFGDSCGDRVILSETEVYAGLEKLAACINSVQPDILLLQEVDVQSKRTAYINEVTWLLNHCNFNHAAYAAMWQAQNIPSDGLGRMNAGNAILSRWEIADAERIQLPLRGDQDALTKYFYLRRNILKGRIALPNNSHFYILNMHADAFSTDDTKRKHIVRFKEELDRLDGAGAVFVAGGDFNMLPPGSDSTDFCLVDKCSDESFHRVGDNPFHKEGSNYTPEKTWLIDIYNRYVPDIPLAQFRAEQKRYFTHTVDRSAFWDRKIDYLFTNTHWVANSTTTHQEFVDASDHAPVSIRWEVVK